MTRLLSFFGAVLALFSPVAVQAAIKTTGKTVDASIISLTAETVTVRGGANKGYKITQLQLDGTGKVQPDANVDTYKVRPETTITLNGLKVPLSDLKPGMKVRVIQTLDPSVAWSITAMTLPPKQAKDATDKTPPKGKGPRKLSSGVDAYKVQSLGTDIVTVAQDGGKKSIAYRINQFTEFNVNGEAGSLGKLKVGMKISVTANTDPTIAARIVARDAD